MQGHSSGKQHRLVLFVIAYLGFISLGLPDALTGIAWPQIRDTFSLPQSGLGLISIALGSGYVLSSFLSGKLTHRLGVGALLAGSSFLVTGALFGKAATPAWPLFLLCATLLGLGSGAIDAGINNFASQYFSARHINWLHACYSLGASIGPLIMTATIVEAGSWRRGYAIVGGILLALAVAFLATRELWSAPAHSSAPPPMAPIGETLRRPFVWLQMAIFFLYTGLELMVGNWCYTLLTESRGISPEAAGLITGGYYGSIGVGRVLLGAIANRVGVDWLVRISLLGAIAGVVLFAAASGATWSLLGLLLLGLGLAPVFPCLMSRTPDRLGPAYAAHAVGFQVSAATTGAACLSALAGVGARPLGLEWIPGLAVTLAIVVTLLHEAIIRLARFSTT